MKTESSANRSNIDLCKLKRVNQFLVINRRLYIVYKNLVWKIAIKDKRYETPLLLTEWLTFLPPNFTEISAMYQRPSGEVVLFIDNDVYMFDVRSLQIIKGYPKQITSLGVHLPYKVNAVLHTYTGRTFLFYNDDYYSELDECSFQFKNYGYTKDYFPGLPAGIDAAFRYINGKIYFFKDDYVYEYDEFSNTFNKKSDEEKAIFEVIGIKCMESTLVSKLIEVLRKYCVQWVYKKRVLTIFFISYDERGGQVR